jgi:hypothetical protein
MSLAKLQSDIYDKLTFIKTAFFQENMQSSPVVGNVNASFSGSTFQERLFSGYTSFKNVYLVPDAKGKQQTTNLEAAPVVYSRAPSDLSYSQMDLPNSQSNANLTTDFTDINFSYFLADGDLVKELNDNRKLYTLLTPENYQRYKNKIEGTSKDDIYVSRYFIGENKTTKEEADVQSMSALVNKLTQANMFTTSQISTAGSSNSACRDCINLYITSSTVALPSGIYDDVRKLNVMNTSTTASTTNKFEFARPNGSTPFTVTVSYYARIDNTTPVTTCSLETVVEAGTFVQTSTKQQISQSWTKIIYTSPSINPSNLNASDKPGFRIRINHNGFSIPVHITGVNVSYNGASSDVNQMFNLTNTDLFTLRRLLLLYECMAHMYIAMYLHENGTYKDTTAKDTTAYDKILAICYENLVNLNRNVNAAAATGESGAVSNISNQVARRMKDYKSQLSTINELNTDLQQLKTGLRSEVDKINTSKTIEARTKKYMYGAVAIFLAVAIACIVAYVVPMKPGMRIGAFVVIVVAAVIVAATLPFIYGNSTEGFYVGGENIYAIQQYQAISSSADRSAVRNAYELGTFDEANKYLMNTIYLANMLQSNINYGNANAAIAKEKEYYQGVNIRLDNSANTLRATVGIIRLDNIVERARMTFFLTITVIVAATVLAIVLASKWPQTHVYIYAAASLVVVVTIILYILDTSARVRTDAEKKYWGKPKMPSS